MRICAAVKGAIRRNNVHPRRWLTGLVSYSRYLGYIKPQLLQSTEEEYLVRRNLLARAWEARELAAPLGKRILVLCPHPDDESIGAGGFLYAHRSLADIHFICLCKGDGGGSLGNADVSNADVNRVALVEARRVEFQRATTALRAVSVQYFDYFDGNVPCSSTREIERLRSIVCDIRPDVVLLPWFLDGHVDHRRANVLYARACGDLEATVLGYEIWSMLEPNAVFDITQYLAAKLSLIQNYTSQLRTVDYVAYASSLAQVRAFQVGLHSRRSGAAEAFVALPNGEYCELVRKLYDGRPIG